jgi:hypothetical protein
VRLTVILCDNGQPKRNDPTFVNYFTTIPDKSSFLLAIFAGREIAAVNRLGLELRRVVFPIGADACVGLHHRVPELVLLDDDRIPVQ